MKLSNPTGMAAPLAHYSHNAEVPAGARWLHVSGQVGVQPDGTIADGIEAQSEWTWKNLVTCLEAADMGVTDIVKVNHFIVDPDHFPAYAAVRNRFLGAHKPASTLLFVKGLVKPDLLVEVEVIAAKAG